MAGTRASLSISKPNDQWIQAQIDSGEFSSRSEVVNDLIRRAREIEAVRTKLIEAELSVEKHGWATQSKDEMLQEFKDELQADGKL